MCWRVEYALLLVISTVVDYSVSHRIAASNNPAIRKRWLLLSLFSNLGILFFFKYFNFINASLAELFGLLEMPYGVSKLDVLLPMGISFYTFQTLAYTIDVYRGTIEPSKHFGKFALYVTFFPQLVAGPIERAQNLLPQFNAKFDFDVDRVQQGLKQMAWGFFKKLVIADRVAVIVDQVYSSPEQYHALALLIATYLFAIQIYCDFSGYSDIAIGAARVLGFKLMDNFKTPYFSRSIREFWSRWHISLSTWFRDYLYISLGGNRVRRWRWYYNLIVVFLISGLWHGANWTFLAWGGIHGLYLVAAIVLFPPNSQSVYRTRIKNVMHIFVTVQLVAFAWIFFRADSIGQALGIVQSIFTWTGGSLNLFDVFNEIGSGVALVTMVLATLFYLIDPWMDSIVKSERKLAHIPSLVLYAGVLAITLIFGHFGESQFIYFQF